MYEQFAATEDPDEATRSLFEEALPAIGEQASDLVNGKYLDWMDSETVHRGDRNEVRRLVLADLQHMASEPGFKSFRVQNQGGTEIRQSQVLCFMGELSRFKGDVAVPVTAWLTEDGCVASGIDPSWK
jgi:hypothetical protein